MPPSGYLLALLASRFIPETEMDAMIDAGIDHIGCHEVRARRCSAGRRPRFVDDSLLEEGGFEPLSSPLNEEGDHDLLLSQGAAACEAADARSVASMRSTS